MLSYLGWLLRRVLLPLRCKTASYTPEMPRTYSRQVKLPSGLINNWAAIGEALELITDQLSHWPQPLVTHISVRDEHGEVDGHSIAEVQSQVEGLAQEMWIFLYGPQGVSSAPKAHMGFIGGRLAHSYIEFESFEAHEAEGLASVTERRIARLLESKYGTHEMGEAERQSAQADIPVSRLERPDSPADRPSVASTPEPVQSGRSWLSNPWTYTIVGGLVVGLILLFIAEVM